MFEISFLQVVQTQTTEAINCVHLLAWGKRMMDVCLQTCEKAFNLRQSLKFIKFVHHALTNKTRHENCLSICAVQTQLANEVLACQFMTNVITKTRHFSVLANVI